MLRTDAGFQALGVRDLDRNRGDLLATVRRRWAAHGFLRSHPDDGFGVRHNNQHMRVNYLQTPYPVTILESRTPYPVGRLRAAYTVPDREMIMEKSIVYAKDLRKQYGGVEALTGLDLAIQPNLVYGLLGPNGAGKSTTLRILSTLDQAQRRAGCRRRF